MALTAKDRKKRYVDRHRDKVNAFHNAYIKRRKEADPEWFKRSTRDSRLRKYGITQAVFDEKWTAQNGCCAICEKPFAEQSKACVDHDHKTGQVRDLLCRPCNVALGVADDDPFLAKLVEYRDRHRAKANPS